jgi:hypothetical protein
MLNLACTKILSLERNHTALGVGVWAVQPIGVVLITGQEKIGIVNIS